MKKFYLNKNGIFSFNAHSKNWDCKCPLFPKQTILLFPKHFIEHERSKVAKLFLGLRKYL